MKLGSILFLFLSIASNATTYYVATTGNDSNNGTAIGTPWRTIQKAVNTATAPGDIVNVAAGSYAEKVNWNSGGTGTLANRITFDGQNVASTTAMYIKKPYVTIKNFRFEGDIEGAFGVNMQLRIMLGAHFTTVQNCVFDKDFQYTTGASKFHGLMFEQPPSADGSFGIGNVPSDCVIEDCEFTQFKGAMCMWVFGDRNIIRNNEFHDLAQGDAIWLWGRNNLIQNNIVHNIYESAGVGNHSDFIQTFGPYNGSKEHIIEGNLIYDLTGAVALGQLEGHLNPDIKDWTWRNNVFANIGNSLSCSIPGMKFYNNTFYRCGLNGGVFGFGSRAYINGVQGWTGPTGTNYATGSIFISNAFVDCGVNDSAFGYKVEVDSLAGCYADYNFMSRGGLPVREDELQRQMGVDGPTYTITAEADDDVVTTNTAHGLSPGWLFKFPTLTGGTPLAINTQYYVKTTPAATTLTLSTTPGGTTVNITVDATAGTLIPTWDYQRWYEPNGINGGDPGFLDPANEDMRISENSVLIAEAQNNNSLFLTDKAGATRGASWDIGAFEFDASDPTTPPTAPSGLSATTASDIRINLSWTDNSSDELGFHVYRSLVSGSGFALIHTTAAGATSYGNTELTPSTQYYYKVCAYNDGGESALTSEVNATTNSVPNAPPAVGRRPGKKAHLLRR